MEYSFYKEYIYTFQFIKGVILTYNFYLNEKFHFIIHAATSADEKLKSNFTCRFNYTGDKKILNFAIKLLLNLF